MKKRVFYCKSHEEELLFVFTLYNNGSIRSREIINVTAGYHSDFPSSLDFAFFENQKVWKEIFLEEAALIL